MKYTGYKISKTSQENVYLAFKYNARQINGIRFSHHFYFNYCTESEDKIEDNRSILPFSPGYNDNYFQANATTGVVLSKDMKTFVFQDSSLQHIDYAPISIEEMSLLEYEN